jgi:SAM-dependent methyltransferase
VSSLFPQDDTDKYDVVIASDCVYRNTGSDLAKAIKKYLAPGGALIVLNPYRDGWDEFAYSMLEWGEGRAQVGEETIVYNNEYFARLGLLTMHAAAQT